MAVPDCSKSKIYKLSSNTDEHFYIGSACGELRVRLAGRGYDGMSGRKHYKLYQYIKNWDEWKIVLIRECPCENRQQMIKEEDDEIVKHIRNPLCLNTLVNNPIAINDEDFKEEHYAKQKANHKEYQKQYRHENKDKLKSYHKQYVDNNNEKLKAYKKQYDECHKDELKEYYALRYKENKEKWKRTPEQNEIRNARRRELYKQKKEQS